ncbi:cytochrome P450 CYP72A219-like [Henckelia pumila]|uniref:cytochrome P450 CYP72A219-like n=1 Tax=Henckelia pumila TaxID=405737 RepID=UPI003C6E7A84
MIPNLSLIFTSTLAAVCIASAVKLLNWVWFGPRKLEKILREQGLNGNPYRFVLGDLKELINVTTEEQSRSIALSDDVVPHIIPYYWKIFKKFGSNSFVWFGPWPRLNVTDPELIMEILRKPEVFQKPVTDSVTGKILTGGIVFLEGQKWSLHRKIINPAFHLEKLKKMVPAMGLSCTSMLEKWESMVSCTNEGSCEIDVWPYIEDLTGDVISRTAFGSSYEEGKRIFHLHRDKLELTLNLLKSSFIPGWKYLPTKTNKRVIDISREMRSLLEGIIKKRVEAIEMGEAIVGDDFLGVLMESNSQENGNNNRGMSIEDVIEECKLFYFAGSETTSCLLVWTIVLLCQFQEWQNLARDEVLGVFGNSEPHFEGLNQLKVVTMILLEVLRLYPPVPLMARGPTQTVKLGNLTIPAGVHMTLLIAELHHDPKIWGEDAEEFKPQRFSKGISNAATNSSGFVPFSSGPRICIGQNFAMIEAKMVVAMILQRFSFELSPSYSHSPFSILTLKPKHGAAVILRSLRSQTRPAS